MPYCLRARFVFVCFPPTTGTKIHCLATLIHFHTYATASPRFPRSPNGSSALGSPGWEDRGLATSPGAMTSPGNAEVDMLDFIPPESEFDFSKELGERPPGPVRLTSKSALPPMLRKKSKSVLNLIRSLSLTYMPCVVSTVLVSGKYSFQFR